MTRTFRLTVELDDDIVEMLERKEFTDIGTYLVSTLESNIEYDSGLAPESIEIEEIK